MKITAVRTHLLEHRLDTPFESASMRFDRRAHILVEIECDDGTVGWGECLGPARPNAAVVQAYAGWLVGQDPRQTEKLWAVLYNALRDQGQRGLSLTALSGIDIALWDIKGKHYGASISMLLGGRWRDSVRAYATGSFKRDGVDRVSDNASEMAERRAEGFHACKIKIGFGIEEDLRVIAAVRDAIGPDMRLMIDANHGYTITEAIMLGNRAADYGIDWFEEPVVPEQLDAYAHVRAGQPIPVAGGETGMDVTACGRRFPPEPWIFSSLISAAAAVFPKRRRSPRLPRYMACASCRMSGARVSRSPPRCNSWRR